MSAHIIIAHVVEKSGPYYTLNVTEVDEFGGQSGGDLDWETFLLDCDNPNDQDHDTVKEAWEDAQKLLVRLLAWGWELRNLDNKVIDTWGNPLQI